jgi:two-component system response regulator AtoC
MNAKAPPDPDLDLEARQREWSQDSETDTAHVEHDVQEDGSKLSPQTFLVIRANNQASFLDLHEHGEWIVGRAPDAQVVVNDRQVSRHHAKLTLADGYLAVEDLGSRNGTLVNGRTLRKSVVRIGTGDVVEVGGCQLVVATRAGRAATARSPLGEESEHIDVVVADPEMARLYASVRKVARMPTTVLVLGETGSGKDILAQRLHAWSPRATKPFVRVNCAGLPDSLLESELFGHERGAFTGADRRHVGYFEAANQGTLFLDEIGELSQGAQLRLLHVLENRTVTRLGGTSPIPIDVRVVCATHRDLQTLVTEERFRADLYFRISPFIVRVAPLRQRPAEIQLLADVFVGQFAEHIGSPPPTIAPDAIALLMDYAWPGNVRELRNAVEHAFVMAEGTTLRKDHFAPQIRGLARDLPPPMSATTAIRKRLLEVERKTIEEALTMEGGNQTRAAARLGMPRRTLVHKLTQYRRQSEGKG